MKLKFLIAVLLFYITAFTQNIGIGTIIPKARLHVIDSSVVFSAGDPLLAVPGNTSVNGAGARMMWYPGKASFRTGFADGTQWDKDNIGFFSFASGYSTLASSSYATAMGRNTTASGTSATALGYFSIASGTNSSAFGAYNQATGSEAMALGSNTLASGFAATSMGFATIAKGDFSVALGSYTKSRSPGSVVIGIYNDTTNNNRLFEIGNGTADNARANAFTVLANGNTGLGTTSPQARLHVSDSAVLFSGPDLQTTTNYYPPASGSGTRLMWYPERAAFRVGSVTGAQWDKGNTGLFSFAAGSNTIANGFNATSFGGGSHAGGDYSTSMGYGTSAGGSSSTSMGMSTNASGNYSTTMGFSSIATGTYSTGLGNVTQANGNASVSMGQSTIANGVNSTTMGIWTQAQSANSLVIGEYNDVSNNNRLFEIGNGTAAVRSNAVTVLKNGNVGIGTINPANQAEIIGPASATPVTAVIGNKGGFGPAALEFVSNYGSASQWRPGYIRSNDLGGFTGVLEFYTNGAGAGSLYSSVKGFEVRNGTALTATGAVGSYSDARLKNNITSFTDGLNVIRKINPVQFYYNTDAPFQTDQQQIGIIAQELEKAAPYMIDRNKQNGYDDLLSVNNQAYTFLLINSIKEQQRQIESQQRRINTQEINLAKQQQQINELKKLVEQLIKK